MKTLILLLIGIGQVFAGGLNFKLNGEKLIGFTEEQVRAGELKGKAGTVRVSDVALFNVFRGYQRTYQGYEFYELMDAVYGARWRMAKRISFVALDGYVQMVFVPALLEAAKGRQGHLAFAEKGLKGFTEIDKQGKKVDPGPFYLVWTGFKSADKASHADTLKWPYQLAAIEIE